MHRFEYGRKKHISIFTIKVEPNAISNVTPVQDRAQFPTYTERESHSFAYAKYIKVTARCVDVANGRIFNVRNVKTMTRNTRYGYTLKTDGNTFDVAAHEEFFGLTPKRHCVFMTNAVFVSRVIREQQFCEIRCLAESIKR